MASSGKELEALVAQLYDYYLFCLFFLNKGLSHMLIYDPLQHIDSICFKVKFAIGEMFAVFILICRVFKMLSQRIFVNQSYVPFYQAIIQSITAEKNP